jgi:hypothetical protein
MFRKTTTLAVLAAILGSFLTATAGADITTGLLGYWPLDGDAADASGNELHGTINGSVMPAPDRLDYPGSALSFPGDAAAHVDVGNPPELQLTGALTLAAWVSLNSGNQNNGRIIAKRGGGGSRSWNINIEANVGGVSNPATFQIAVNPNDSVIINDTKSLPTDEWAHVVGVYRPGEAVELYVNAELRVSETQGIPNAQFSDNGLPVLIGARNACGGCGWDGLIDEARIYDRALSAGDVRELHEFVPSPRFQAWGPEPADGVSDVILPLLTWKAGVTALLHEVYFGTDPNLGAENLVQSRSPAMLYFHAPGLTPGTTYYWRVDEVEADMTTVHTGEVWSFTAMPYMAYLPNPADGATDVSPDPNVTLSWQAGRESLEHHLYSGASFDDVNDGAPTADMGRQTGTSFVLADPLGPLNTYYWRVDEIGLDGTVRTGDVWSFTTFNVVDDFESYTNEVGQRVFEVWVDGIGFTQPEPGNPGNGTGAAVGHDIWNPESPHFEGTIMETGIIHGGAQSMPVYYDNTGQPYHSEAERIWSTPQNWTATGATALTLYVRGLSANTAERLYVVLQDSAGGTAVVPYADPAAATSNKWLQWKIQLSDLPEVNAAAIRKLIVGAGNRETPFAGGTGLLYVDNVRLTRD